MHQLCRGLLAALAVGLLWVVPAGAPAQEAVVHTTDGRQIAGQLVSQNQEQVVLRVAGIDTPVARSNIERVEIRLSLEDEFRQRRADIADDDVDERYKLALWLFEQRAYALAKTELEDMAQRFPDDGRVAHLRPLVEARLKLQRDAEAQAQQQSSSSTPAAAPKPAASDAPAADSPDTAGRGPADLLERRLTQEQVNLIKVYEIELDTQPRVRIPREVMTEVMERYAHREEVPRGRSDQMRVLAAPGWQQLDLLFALRAREYYDQVQITGDPETVSEFRRLIHRRYVLAYCGSNQCHGGEEAGDLFLFTQRANDEQTVYTNYYILNEYQNARGYMIDRDQPERSLLVQYALPRQEAYTAHPDVRGWRPRFNSMQHPQAQALVNWIVRLGRPKPNIPINYRWPGASPVPVQPSEPAEPQTTPPAGPTQTPAP